MKIEIETLAENQERSKNLVNEDYLIYKKLINIKTFKWFFTPDDKKENEKYINQSEFNKSVILNIKNIKKDDSDKNFIWIKNRLGSFSKFDFQKIKNLIYENIFKELQKEFKEFNFNAEPKLRKLINDKFMYVEQYINLNEQFNYYYLISNKYVYKFFNDKIKISANDEKFFNAEIKRFSICEDDNFNFIDNYEKFLQPNFKFSQLDDFKLDEKDDIKISELDDYFDVITDKNQEVFLFFQELLGSCISPKALSEPYLYFLIASGENGKSVFGRLLSTIIDDSFIGSIPFNGFANFNKWKASEKMVMFADEMSKSAGDSEFIKQATDGNKVEADIKNLNSVEIYPTATFITATNQAFINTDSSWGFERRLKIIPFPKITKENKKSKTRLYDMFDKYKKYLLCFAFAGFVRFFYNNFKHTESKIINQSTKEFLDGQNNYKLFLEDLKMWFFEEKNLIGDTDKFLYYKSQNISNKEFKFSKKGNLQVSVNKIKEMLNIYIENGNGNKYNLNKINRKTFENEWKDEIKIINHSNKKYYIEFKLNKNYNDINANDLYFNQENFTADDKEKFEIANKKIENENSKNTLEKLKEVDKKIDEEIEKYKKITEIKRENLKKLMAENKEIMKEIDELEKEDFEIPKAIIEIGDCDCDCEIPF